MYAIIVDLDDRVFARRHPADARPEVIADRLEWLPSGASEPFVLELPPYFDEIHGET